MKFLTIKIWKTLHIEVYLHCDRTKVLSQRTKKEQ